MQERQAWEGGIQLRGAHRLVSPPRAEGADQENQGRGWGTLDTQDNREQTCKRLLVQVPAARCFEVVGKSCVPARVLSQCGQDPASWLPAVAVVRQVVEQHALKGGGSTKSSCTSGGSEAEKASAVWLAQGVRSGQSHVATRWQPLLTMWSLPPEGCQLPLQEGGEWVAACGQLENGAHGFFKPNCSKLWHNAELPLLPLSVLTSLCWPVLPASQIPAFVATPLFFHQSANPPVTVPASSSTRMGKSAGTAAGSPLNTLGPTGL